MRAKCSDPNIRGAMQGRFDPRCDLQALGTRQVRRLQLSTWCYRSRLAGPLTHLADRHVSRNRFFLCVHPSVPGSTLQEFLTYAEGNPRKLHHDTAFATSILASAQLF